MSHVGTAIIHRFVVANLSCSRWASPAQILRSLPSIYHGPRTLAWNIAPERPSVYLKLYASHPVAHQRLFSTTTAAALQHGFVSRAHQASGEPQEEKGLAFQVHDLDGTQLRQIFGRDGPPPRVANRFLRVLHARRHDGTLDLPLSERLEELKLRFPHALNDGLQWLRINHPYDEDAAILKRIEREEANEEDYSPAELQQRALDVGLYEQSPKYHGPQSGYYQAQASEKEGDVFGRSTIDKIRAENIAKAEQEEAELQAQIDEKMAKAQALHDERSKALAERPEQGIEKSDGTINPPNVYERWMMQKQNEAQSNITASKAEELTLLQRLLPSTVFVALVCVGCYLFAQYWSPPRRSNRMFPDVSLSVATIGTIMALNAAVLVAWRLPMFWRVLNKYFYSTPGYPKAVSMVLNTFSHDKKKHLLSNMLGIVLFGLSLHEEVGRGWFVAIYVASGAFGSLASLTSFSIKRLYSTYSNGASGCLWGVMSAYCWLHAK